MFGCLCGGVCLLAFVFFCARTGVLCAYVPTCMCVCVCVCVCVCALCVCSTLVDHDSSQPLLIISYRGARHAEIKAA